MATIKVQRVLRGISNLSESEIKELAQSLTSNVEVPAGLTKSSMESLQERTLIKATTMHMGGSDQGGCPCCGR